MKVVPHKQEHILEAAIKRFAHFGIQKTTLTEIADDLAISKQALFYYFSDKQSLIAAVEEKIILEYINELEQEFLKCKTVAEALEKLLIARKKIYKEYYMLVAAMIANETLTNSLDDVKTKMKEKETALVTELLQRGIRYGELKPLEPAKTSALLLETLSAFAQCAMDRKVIPDADLIEQLSQKQKEVLHLFYNGLKNY